MTEQEQAYADLKQAARDLARAARAFQGAHPGQGGDLMAALCSAVVGTILDPGSWAASLRPMALAVVEVAKAGIDDMKERGRMACN